MAEINRLKEQARAFYQKAEWEKAKRAVEQIVSLEPENAEFSLALASIYRKAGEDRRSLDMYEKALRLSEKAGDFSRAIAASKKILSIDKDRVELYNKIAEGYLKLGLKSGAVKEWIRYADQLKIRSDFMAVATVYQRIADSIPENPSLKESFHKIKELAEIAVSDDSESAPEPADIVPYRRLVDVALKMGQTRKIVETQLSYARVLQRRGFVGKALSVYQKVLERDPGNEEALARVLSPGNEKNPDNAKSQVEFLEACKFFQEQVWHKIDELYEPYYDLGMLFRQEGLKDEAVVEFQNTIKGGGRQLKGFEMLAVSFLEQGDYGLAKEVLNQGLSIRKFLDNEYVGLHYNLGMAHEQLGDFQKALYEYEQVYIIDITYKDVAKRLRDLETKIRLPAQPAVVVADQKAPVKIPEGVAEKQPPSEQPVKPAGEEEKLSAAEPPITGEEIDYRKEALALTSEDAFETPGTEEKTSEETREQESHSTVLNQRDKGLSFL